MRGRYNEKELNETYIGNVYRYDLIYKYYCKYGSKRALGFCCSREHAEEMARQFCERGISSVAVYSNSNGEYSEDRNIAIEKLTKGEIKVIFSVDMFNEGVDIPAVDMVMFLRPTESPIVFLQQLGRGLRKSIGKKYLNVLDFIGNYEKAGKVRFLLTEEKLAEINQYGYVRNSNIPDDCIIDFDMKLIDLFEEMDKKQLKLKDRIKKEYFRIKELLGKSPSRTELFTYMDDEIYQMARTRLKENPFKKYLEYKEELGELTEKEKEVCKSVDSMKFIMFIENTSMTKVYKMPVLMSFIKNGSICMEVTEQDILEKWKEFFSTGTNWKDLESEITYEKYQAISDKEHIKKILAMPVKYLQDSGKEIFRKKEGAALALKEELSGVVNNPIFVEQVRDAINYRIIDYCQRRYRKNKEEGDY